MKRRRPRDALPVQRVLDRELARKVVEVRAAARTVRGTMSTLLRVLARDGPAGEFPMLYDYPLQAHEVERACGEMRLLAALAERVRTESRTPPRARPRRR